MNDRPLIPWLGDLLGHVGAVPTVFISLGFLFVGIGALGDFALDNTRLLFGFLLVFFGLVCFYGGQDKVWRCHQPGASWCDIHQTDGRRHVHVEWGNVGSFVVCLVIVIALGFLIFRQYWPPRS